MISSFLKDWKLDFHSFINGGRIFSGQMFSRFASNSFIKYSFKILMFPAVMKTYCMHTTHLECSSLGYGFERLGVRTNMKFIISSVLGESKSTDSDLDVHGIHLLLPPFHKNQIWTLLWRNTNILIKIVWDKSHQCLCAHGMQKMSTSTVM